jgi:hypothetical protein
VSHALVPAINRAVAWFTDLHSRGLSLTDSADLKMVKEAKEYAEDPSLEEAADVFIALVGSLWHKGWDTHDLAVAVQLKMAINEEREWVRLEDGTFQHT